ncbi:MAG: PPC domain-containing DNA-binding protein [Patescibacteria group bacterium]
MKLVLQDNRRYILRFDAGEDIIAGTTQLLKDQKISACSISGIGSCASIELGYFNTHLKDYRKKPFFEELEILSLIGNGALKDGVPFIHAHGVFSRTDFTVLGGHVFKAVVSATAEIFVLKLEGEMKRELNVDVNLNLLV